MKKILVSSFVIAFALLLSFQCFATDVDVYYSGPLAYDYDVEDSSSDDDEESGRIKISNDVSYDSSTALYYFYADGIAEPFSSNVCSGMITKDPVNINVPEGISATLYKDSETYTEDFTEISGVGKYTLQVKDSDGYDRNILRFTIIGDSTGTINSFTVPDGFRITSAIKDEDSIYDSDTISLDEEGVYSIRYVAENTGVPYTLDFSVDRTPPTLALSEIKDGKAWGPVSLADLEQGATITVVRDGEVEGYTDNQLTKSGKYTLYVYDAAMNMTEYNFSIMIYFNMGSIFLLIAILLIIVGVVVFIIISKTKLRVR